MICLLGILTEDRGFQQAERTFALLARIRDLRLPNGPLTGVMFCVVRNFSLVTSV